MATPRWSGRVAQDMTSVTIEGEREHSIVPITRGHQRVRRCASTIRGQFGITAVAGTCGNEADHLVYSVRLPSSAATPRQFRHRPIPYHAHCPSFMPELPDPLPVRLNLGCGQYPREGFLNVDIESFAKADILLDLNDPTSYEGLPAAHFELIVLDHVLEHLRDVFPVMRSLARLLAPGGRLEIRVPHFSRGFTHSQHEHGFDVTFVEYFNPRFTAGFVGVELQLESMRLDYMIRWDLKRPFIRGWQESILKTLNVIVTWFANLSPFACSRFWCYWVGGFEQIEYIFLKPDNVGESDNVHLEQG